MINKFATVYAGHIDFPDHGQNATPANERRFNNTPMWHPLRLAEDFATADLLTKGRTVFGVGRGYHSREVETFGAPIIDQNANRELFEEQVEILSKSFNSESFSHKGKHYTLPPEVPYRG